MIEFTGLVKLNLVKKYTQITNNIRWGEAVPQNVHREGIFEPFILIH